MILQALAEYAGIVSRSHGVFAPPSNLGDCVRWLFIGLGAYLALRLVWGALRSLIRG